MAANTKLSFSFGGVQSSGPAVKNAAPKSNMEALLAKTKGKTTKPTPASLFDDEDEADQAAPPSSLAGPSRSRGTPTAPPVRKTIGNSNSNTAPSSGTLGRASRKAQEEALLLDSTAFEYDAVYDQLKARERLAEAAKKAESEDRKPKYIENFLASAQTRKLDRLRAEEKMLALEREKEGDEFGDKEKFVTEGYKKQMEEVRKAEEEEKQREEALRKSTKGSGLTAFYKNMLDSSSAEHDAAIEASNPTSSTSLAVKPPTAALGYETEAEYDPFLAREAAAASSSGNGNVSGNTGIQKKKVIGPDGEEVEMNDEGEVVDKRELLKAGLNITKKPKVELPDSLRTGGRNGTVLEGPYVSKAVGTAAGYQDRMRRERERLAQNMKEENERKRAEAERREREEEEAARKRREGDDGLAERRRAEAKERFLARKREREGGGAGGDEKGKEDSSAEGGGKKAKV